MVSVDPTIQGDQGLNIEPLLLEPCVPKRLSIHEVETSGQANPVPGENSNILTILQELQKEIQMLGSKVDQNNENLNKKIDDSNQRVLQLGIASNRKLDFLTKTVPSIMAKAGRLVFKNIFC